MNLLFISCLHISILCMYVVKNKLIYTDLHPFISHTVICSIITCTIIYNISCITPHISVIDDGSVDNTILNVIINIFSNPTIVHLWSIMFNHLPLIFIPQVFVTKSILSSSIITYYSCMFYNFLIVFKT